MIPYSRQQITDSDIAVVVSALKDDILTGGDKVGEFEKAIADVTFADPKIDLFSNVTGEKVVKGSDAKKNAVLHLTNPVRWTLEEKVLADGIAYLKKKGCTVAPESEKLLRSLNRR